MTSSALRGALAALTALLLAVSVAGAADPAPTFNGCGRFVKDNAGDASDPVSDQTGAPDDAEILGAWLTYDAAKGAEGTTVNIQVKNLSGKPSPPATSFTYDLKYSDGSPNTKFVRAFIDLSGSVVYEYGHLEVVDASATSNTRYTRDGETKGNLFPGANGVAQIVIPADQGGKPGSTLKGAEAEVQVGRTAVVPGTVNQSPTRGLSYSDDQAALGAWVVAGCAPGTTGGGGGQTVAPAPGTTTTTPGTSQQTAASPITLVTKSVKHVKKDKTIKIKVKSSEALTKVAARVSKGKSALGAGKLAKLNGAGTLKIKLKKALKKGTYAFDVTGTDAQGRQRPASFTLKVK